MNAKLKLIVSMLIFGSMGIFVRTIGLPSSITALARGGIGVLFLFLLCVLTKTRISPKAMKQNLLLLLCSGAALGANWIFLFEAYRHTTIAVATLSYYFAPVLITAASPFVLKEKLTGGKLGCMAASVLGMALISGVIGSGSALDGGIGVLFGLAAAASYAGFTLMNKFTKELNALDATIAQLGIATIVLLPYTLLTQNVSGIHLQAKSVLFLVVLGVIHTGLGFWLFFASIQQLKAQTAAMLSYIDPITAILFAAIFLRERMEMVQIAGACLILGAAVLSERFSSAFQKQNKPCLGKQANAPKQAAASSVQ